MQYSLKKGPVCSLYLELTYCLFVVMYSSLVGVMVLALHFVVLFVSVTTPKIAHRGREIKMYAEARRGVLAGPARAAPRPPSGQTSSRAAPFLPCHEADI